VPQQTAPITFRKATSMPIGRDRLLNLIEISLDPLVLVVSLWVVALVVGGHLLPRHVILGLVVFSLTFPGSLRLTQTLPGVSGTSSSAGSRYPGCS
jgi:hypothetical protein